MEGVGARLRFAPTPAELACLAASLPHWQPFPDTVAALRALQRRYKLAVISNIDHDLFAATAPQLQVSFDWVITAEQVQAYKPSTQNFTYALAHIGVPPTQILHVAQSLYHDIVPAKHLGLAAVWVNRYQSRPGATPAIHVEPDLEVPDLRTLVAALGLR
jgi:2-haloacid dehalogenase